MSPRRLNDVCAAVVSHLPYDARVWKEARSLADAGYRVSLVGLRYDIPHIRRVNEAGVQVVEIPFGSRGGWKSRVKRGVALARLWGEVLRTPARVYHAHNIHTIPPAWLASRIRGAALVYDAHELYGEAFEDRFAARVAAPAAAALETFAVRQSDAVLTTNPGRARVLERSHGRRSVHVLANVPVAPEHIEPLDPGYPAGRTVLLYQGGIYARARAFQESIQALKLLPEIDLVVVGFGRDADIALVKRWALEAGVADRVHLLGPRPREELVRTAAAASVGLVPIRPKTLNDVLGDTNKLHEYLMAGLPMAASDLPEIRRVVMAGDPPVGELFDARSPASIASAVRRVLEDKELYERRRQEARRLARERFSWQIEERTLLSLYGELANGSRAERIAARRSLPALTPPVETSAEDEYEPFWSRNQPGLPFTSAALATPRFFAEVEAHRYAAEPHIPHIVRFDEWRERDVLEVGCGIGTDALQFARAGACYTGLDFSARALELAQRRFELAGERGRFVRASATKLPFEDGSFDLVYAHGVIHHVAETERTIAEIHRVLRPGGTALSMVYHRRSLNYAVTVMAVRRVFAAVLLVPGAAGAITPFTGKHRAVVEGHMELLRRHGILYLTDRALFLSNNTDGPGNPLSKAFTRAEARSLFRAFSDVRLAVRFLNLRLYPGGARVSKTRLAQVAERSFGWHLYVRAVK